MTTLDQGFSSIEFGEGLPDEAALDSGVMGLDASPEDSIAALAQLEQEEIQRTKDMDKRIEDLVVSYSRQAAINTRVEQLVAPEKRDEVMAGIEHMKEVEDFLKFWGRVWGLQFRAWNN